MKPIENDFPIEKVNEIANEEGKGGTSRPSFEPLLYIHKWWARRLGSVFRSIVISTLLDEDTKIIKEDGSSRKVTPEEIENPCNLYLKNVDFNGKIILDPFMGAGTTVIEGLRTNCKVIGQDLNPIPWLMVKNEIEPIDLVEAKKAFNSLEKEISGELKKYHKTICPHCLEKYAKRHDKKPEEVIEDVCYDLRVSGDPEFIYEKYSFEDNSKILSTTNIFADAMYYFWIKEIFCDGCKKPLNLFKSYILSNKKKGKKLLGYNVICPYCGEIFLIDKKEKENATCPKCKSNFNPTKGNAKGTSYICPNKNCGHKSKIVENIKKNGNPNEHMYAVEYYCPHCEKKYYKKTDSFDVTLFKSAKQEYEKVKSDWAGQYIPNSKIPKGDETYPRLIENHGYKYWEDMFNERQLLNLGKLLKAILDLKVDSNIKEFSLLAFSKALEYNNMLCEYNRKNSYIRDLFRMHAYHPSLNPVENNLWGAKFGFGTFKNHFGKNLKYKEYNKTPFEKYVNSNGKNEKKYMKINVIGKIGDFFKNDNYNAIINCGDSSYITIPDKSVDAVITDPPYYGNVMYSELSEFFYSWLRLKLKDKYEHFRSENVPNSAEVIVNDVQGKDDEDFIEGLTAVFKESNRKLKDEGLLVFTFHHQEEKAWGAVLQSVLNSGFFITAIYPVQSEMETSTHIHLKSNVRYDMVVVCKKRDKKAEKRHWSQIEDDIYFKVEDELKRLGKHGSNISEEDIFVITIGKCLEVYSKHYPNIYNGENRVTINEALSSISEIVDSQLMHTRFNQIQSETDTITALYLFYFTNKTNISYDSLNKMLKIRSIPMDLVNDSKLVEKEDNQLLILTPHERAKLIESKKKESLSAIDKVHYLFYLWNEGKIYDFKNALSEDEKSRWVSDSVIKTLEYIFEIENDKTYQDILKFMNDKWMVQERLEV